MLHTNSLHRFVNVQNPTLVGHGWWCGCGPAMHASRSLWDPAYALAHMVDGYMRVWQQAMIQPSISSSPVLGSFLFFKFFFYFFIFFCF